MSGEEGFRAWAVGAHRRLVHFAELLTTDHGRAEDLVQEALASTYAAWPRVHAGNPDAYARRCIINGRTDWLRRRASTERPYAELPDHIGTTDEMGSADERLLVLTALRRLTHRERAVLALRYYLGQTESEVGAELGITVGTVKSTTSWAIMKLRTDVGLREAACR